MRTAYNFRLFFLFVLILELLSCSQSQQNNQENHQPSFTDNIYKNSSRIDSIAITPERIIQLKKLCFVWGILKYFHPALTSGKVGCDPSLFKIIPKIISVQDNKTDSVLLDWIVGLGELAMKSDESNLNPDVSKIFPNWDTAGEKLFSPDLLKKLITLKAGFRYSDSNWYARFTPIGNPVFTNESEYSGLACPDAGIRQLALFRYWNMIQYYYPYRYLVSDWYSILDKFIPVFNSAVTPALYAQACIKLVAEIKDTHANVFGNNTIDSLKGMYVCPFQTKFIGDKLIVSRSYLAGKNVNVIKPGDIINSIDFLTPAQYIKKYSNSISASNNSAFLKLLFSSAGYALRSNKIEANITFIRDGKKQSVRIKKIPVSDVSPRNDWSEQVSVGFSSINDSIGYIYPELLKKGDYQKIITDLSSKKGLIIDMRCYPSIFLPSFLCTWLQCDTTPFAKVKTIAKDFPGTLDNGKPARISNTEMPPGTFFKGKLVILINSSTISQGEFTTMALAHRANSIVIGSETAGADGDVSIFAFPGGIKTLISGTAIYYPDGRETQRIGIVPQLTIAQSLESIRKNADIQYGAALDWLNK